MTYGMHKQTVRGMEGRPGFLQQVLLHVLNTSTSLAINMVIALILYIDSTKS